MWKGHKLHQVAEVIS